MKWDASFPQEQDSIAHPKEGITEKRVRKRTHCSAWYIMQMMGHIVSTEGNGGTPLTCTSPVFLGK